MIEKDLKDQYITQKTILTYIFATHMHHEKKVELKTLMDLLERFIQKVLIFPQYRKMKLIMKLKKLMRFIGKL